MIKSVQRKREIVNDYNNGARTRDLIAKYKISRQRINAIIHEMDERDTNLVPDDIDTVTWRTLKKAGLLIQEALAKTDAELMKIRQLGVQRIQDLRKYQKKMHL